MASFLPPPPNPPHPQHYYNLETQGLDESVDSNLCSCATDLDESVQYHQCFSCGNAFTTTRTLSTNPEKIFCDDCSQIPEYLSRSSLDLLSSCDETVTSLRAKVHTRLHSNDSGVKVSSEGAYDDYLVSAGPRATAFAKKLAQSLQSVCSECKGELEPPEVVLWGVNSQSLSSVCSLCKAQVELETYRNVSSTPAKHPTAVRVNGSRVISGQDRERGKSGSEQKSRLEERFSSDSGIKLGYHYSAALLGYTRPSVLQETDVVSSTGSAVARKYALPSSLNHSVVVGSAGGGKEVCFSPVTTRFSLGCPTPFTSGCPTPGRLSAHPRNRLLFDELGFEETDV